VARELADLATGETRSAITGLHSPVLDDLGLAAGLVSMARSVPQLQVDVDAEELALPDHVTVALFRIAQEAVQNVVKHAGASHARVRLHRHGGTAVLTVNDDGCGFDAPGAISALPHRDPERPRYGLAGMFERVQLLGGQLAVSSRPEGGTRVRAVIPLSPPATPGIS
jgi:signal transduction histidine kinase